MEKKYSNFDKLERERRRAAEMNDEELAQLLQQEWENNDFPELILPADDKEQLYADISSKIFDNEENNYLHSVHERKSLLWKMVKYAAILLMPLLAVASFYLYEKSNHGTEQMIVVQTDRGERITVTLPDGSEVYLNSASVLSYSSESFSEGKREVKFEGEAFFTVTSDPTHPFLVKTGEVNVNVIGTEFNVFSRKNVEDISVFLRKGTVEIHCEGVADVIKLKPSQKAIFDKQNKEIEIINTDNYDNDISWLNNELVFNNEPLEEVINKIEISYGVDFDTQNYSHFSKDRFTGTVPMDDLSKVIDIIEDVYEIKLTVKNKK